MRATRTRRLGRFGAAGTLAGLIAMTCGAAAGASPHTASGLSYRLAWSRSIPGGTISLSSPIAATLDSTPAVVVGSRDGKVYALRLTTGATLPGWPATTPGDIAVASTPSVGGGLVYVGVGTSSDGKAGGYLALRQNGTRAWYRTVDRLPAGDRGNSDAGVQASMAYGLLQGKEAVVAGSMGQYEDAFVASSGATLHGFPWFAADSEFSTPAIADLYGNGQDEIVEGGASTAGVGMGRTYRDGGHIRVLAATGHGSAKNQSVGLDCVYNSDEEIDSSPAVGRFLAGAAVGIVDGTGTGYPGVSDEDSVIALNSHCGKVWQAKLDGATTDSPALVEASSISSYQVAEGTAVTSTGKGTVYLLDGANGSVIWKTNVAGEVIGGITSAALTGSVTPLPNHPAGRLASGATQDLLVPTTKGLVILDGRSGATLAVLGDDRIGLQSSPLVTDDSDGQIGVTIAGYNADGGIVQHYEFGGTTGADADEAGAWPMFHRDPQLTGTTLLPPVVPLPQ